MVNQHKYQYYLNLINLHKRNKAITSAIMG